MKPLLLLFFTLLLQINAGAQTDTTQKAQVAQAACGECQLGLKGNGCTLAVRINGKAYFVDGTGIDDHGDAHAQNGFCNAIWQAEVKGKIKNHRFVASYFKLLPEPAKKN